MAIWIEEAMETYTFYAFDASNNYALGRKYSISRLSAVSNVSRPFHLKQIDRVIRFGIVSRIRLACKLDSECTKCVKPIDLALLFEVEPFNLEYAVHSILNNED